MLNPSEEETNLNPFAKEFGDEMEIKEQEKELPEDGRVSGVPRKIFSSDHEKIKALQHKHFSNELKVYDILDDLLNKMDNPKVINALEKRFEKETVKKEKAPEVKTIRVTTDFIEYTKNFTTVDRGNRFHGTKKLDFKTVFSIILDEYLKKYTQF